LHSYTHGLIDSVPGRNKKGQPLRQIPGMTPSLLELPPGCAFRERCTYADAACQQDPALSAPIPGRQVRCFHPLVQKVPA
jgi:peptide/nickel transport system ATP-binding protein